MHIESKKKKQQKHTETVDFKFYRLFITWMQIIGAGQYVPHD